MSRNRNEKYWHGNQKPKAGQKFEKKEYKFESDSESDVYHSALNVFEASESKTKNVEQEKKALKSILKKGKSNNSQIHPKEPGANNNEKINGSKKLGAQNVEPRPQKEPLSKKSEARDFFEPEKIEPAQKIEQTNSEPQTQSNGDQHEQNGKNFEPQNVDSKSDFEPNINGLKNELEPEPSENNTLLPPGAKIELKKIEPKNNFEHDLENGGTKKLGRSNSGRSLRKYNKYLKITKLHLFLPWLSLTLYIFDVISDQILAVRYAINGEWVYASLTFAFVFLPACYISIFVGITWKQILNQKWLWWPLLVPLWLFNLEPAVLYMKNFLTVRKYLEAKEKKNVQLEKKYYDKFINGNRNVSDLKYTEGLMEAVPQFTLQGYILLSTFVTLKFNDKLILQLWSMSSSIIGLLVIIFIRHKVYLLANGYTVTSFGRSLWTLGRFFSLVPRVLSMTASASIFPAYTFLAIGIHWVLATAWRYFTHLKILGFVEPIFQGAADTLVPRVDTLGANVVSHIVILVEDLAMLVIWSVYVPSDFGTIRYIFPAVVFTLDCVGCATDIIYKKYNEMYTHKIDIDDI